MSFLFVDKITHSTSHLIRGIKKITADDFYLYPNVSGPMMFVPSLIGEALGQLAAWNIMQRNNFANRPVAGVVAQARLMRPAYVGETLVLESTIDAVENDLVQYHSIATVGDEPAFYIDGALGPLLPMEDFIAPKLAKQQYLSIAPQASWKNPLTNQGCCEKALFHFDHISEFEPNSGLVAEKMVLGSAPYFPDHFPDKPVLPLTVLLECKLNLAHEFAKRAGWPSEFYVNEVKKIKMNAFVRPGDCVVTRLTIKKFCSAEGILYFQSKVNGKRVCVLEIVMKPREK